MALIEELLNWDRALFRKINGEWTNSFFDTVLPITRNPNIWVPLYLFLIVFAVVNYKRNGWLWVLFAVLTAAMTDIVSSHVIKELVFRLRPCHDTALNDHLRFLVNYCPQSSSFTSSHAANHFALAMYIFITLKNQTNKWIRLIFLWAFIISYAQVYVGVHYPIDIICGAAVGCIIGYGWAHFFNSSFILQPRDPKPNLTT